MWIDFSDWRSDRLGEAFSAISNRELAGGGDGLLPASRTAPEVGPDGGGNCGVKNEERGKNK